jgi:vitamin B12 transporter
MTGVINIITRKGKGAMKLEMSAEGGSYGNSRFSASSFGKTGKLDYSFGVSRFNTDGVSAARDGTEDDGYGNTILSGLVGIHLLQNLSFEVGIRQNEAKSELDSFGADDPNYMEESKSLIYFAKALHNVNEKWDHALKFSINETSLDYKDPDTSWNNSEIDTRIENVDWQHNFYLSDEANILTAGIEYEKQLGENKGFFNESIDNRAFYLQDQANLVSRKLSLVAGIRLDDHSKFGKETTYRFAGSYRFSESLTRIKGSWGTGFKAPTLNNLFYQDPWGSKGNPNLKPEKSIGYDIAIEQDIIEKTLMLSAAYFHIDFDNLIQWVEYATWSYEPRNVSKAETDGWEIGLNSNLPKDFQLNASYTITNTKDKVTAKELARRPRDKAGITASWNPKNGNLTVSYNYVGKRWDDTKNTKGLEHYTKIDVSGSYHLTKVIRLFGRIENLTDENYEEVKGFGVLRRGYYAGIKAEF